MRFSSHQRFRRPQISVLWFIAELAVRRYSRLPTSNRCLQIYLTCHKQEMRRIMYVYSCMLPSFLTAGTPHDSKPRFLLMRNMPCIYCAPTTSPPANGCPLQPCSFANKDIVHYHTFAESRQLLARLASSSQPAMMTSISRPAFCVQFGP